MENKKLIITGGLGFIFSHVTEYFVKKGWQVVVIDDMGIGSHPEIVNESFKFIRMDCAEYNVQDAIITEDPDYIIHAAAISDVDKSIVDPEYVLRQNTLASINVFEAARFCPNLKKLLYVSTDEVYGECEHRKDETEILFSRNPYSISKAFGSLMRLGYDNTYQGLQGKTCETRFCNVFGDRQDNRKILSIIKNSVDNDAVVPIHNGGIGSREYIYVKNIPPLMELLLEKGWRVYNVTLNDSFTVNDLVKMAEQVTGKQIKTTESFRPGMDMKYQMSADRLKEEFNWLPLYSFEQGLAEYLK